MKTCDQYKTELAQLEQRLVGCGRRAAWRELRLACWRLVMDANRMIKRLLDILIAAMSLLIFAPLFLIVAILIKLTDGGPILFWQDRIGKWGRPFRFPKFRSMVVDAENLKQKLIAKNSHGDESITFKIQNDPRTTHIGRFIRKTSIDELPQLWCVLKGDMSLVGPRPALVKEAAQYSLDDRVRLDVLPGLTCIWQVSGRSDIPFPQQVEMDMAYIKQQSVMTDIKLLLRTIPAVISGRGAY